MKDPEEIKVEVTSIQAVGGPTRIVRPIGEIDLGRSPSLRRHLADARAGVARLVVDLSGVPYMDSSGVATLVETMQATRRTGTTLVLCGLQEKVRSIFEIARLDAVFTIVATRDDAVSSQ